MIVARYCARAIWQDDLSHIRQRWQSEGISFGLLRQLLGAFFRFRLLDDRLRMAEFWADGKGKMVLWMKGSKAKVNLLEQKMEEDVMGVLDPLD